MRRYIAGTLTSFALLSSINAAFAEDTDAAKSTDAKTETVKTEPAKTVKTPKKTSSGGSGGIASIPAHMASFVAGTVVGIPVSIFRKSKQETINATKDLVGDSDNKVLIGAAGTLGVPAGVISGTMQGVVYGIWNAWKGSADEPFSEEAFSLGDSK